MQHSETALMEVILKAVQDIPDTTEAHEFLDKIKPKVGIFILCPKLSIWF